MRARPQPVNHNTELTNDPELVQRHIFFALATISEQLDCLLERQELSPPVGVHRRPPEPPPPDQQPAGVHDEY